MLLRIFQGSKIFARKCKTVIFFYIVILSEPLVLGNSIQYINIIGYKRYSAGLPSDMSVVVTQLVCLC